MIGRTVLAGAALAVGGSLLAQRPATPSAYCAATVERTATLGIIERLAIRPAPDCPARGVVRARKRSVLNAEGPYQPIYPLRGAWQIPSGGVRNEWVGRSWSVEYWNGRAWVPAGRLK
ncbi:hypothetical protein GCM10008959_26330 [Deinococcus seoulensis]|uniref:SH3 domain-containing protein n=1 Tax=Deinococcus seoulensis TaxID=1837379 RepID=A0ABQ2RX54_9DEIO|nr:hypothetical protein [Deinococcus seoulensis]GGR62979.1 hypothetical protein GCM10008959_26330 [Deinococcus seoulensis]